MLNAPSVDLRKTHPSRSPSAAPNRCLALEIAAPICPASWGFDHILEGANDETPDFFPPRNRNPKTHPPRSRVCRGYTSSFLLSLALPTLVGGFKPHSKIWVKLDPFHNVGILMVSPTFWGKVKGWSLWILPTYYLFRKYSTTEKHETYIVGSELQGHHFGLIFPRLPIA